LLPARGAVVCDWGAIEKQTDKKSS
jgi:hypothetical protein